MAYIRPFRALRYNPRKIRDINLKFSPLFDVVSKEQLRQLYNVPNNSIHVSVPKSLEDALNKLNEWKGSGVLLQDPLPGIYIYYQEFSLYGKPQKYIRKGFVSMIRLSSPESEDDGDNVLHEGTIKSSVKERSFHLEHTLLNTAPTHGLYNDPEFGLEEIMDRYMEHPIYEYIDYQGVVNKLAIVQDRRDIEKFQKVLQDKRIYLADGHHRLASSRSLRNKLLREGKISKDDDSMIHYHLMYLTNLKSDDLKILPIHRSVAVPGEIDVDDLLRKLDKYFYVTDVTMGKAPLFEELKGRQRSIGMVIQEKHYVLSLKEDLDPEEIVVLDVPSPVKQLPYTLLHYLVIDRILGVPYDEQPLWDGISYVKDYATAIKSSMEDRQVIAFIMNDLDMDQMMAVCSTGALMPQKSTYFYPKVVCGLVFASIDDHENKTPFDLSFGVSS